VPAARHEVVQICRPSYSTKSACLIMSRCHFNDTCCRLNGAPTKVVEIASVADRSASGCNAPFEGNFCISRRYLKTKFLRPK
jgi:hypothetical protein